MSAPVCTCWIEAKQENERCGSVLECPKHQNGQVEKLNPYHFGAGTIRERLMALAAKWRSLKEVKDLGELGPCFDGHGYDKYGFRPLNTTERQLLAMCANELGAALEAASALPVDEP